MGPKDSQACKCSHEAEKVESLSSGNASASGPFLLAMGRGSELEMQIHPERGGEETTKRPTVQTPSQGHNDKSYRETNQNVDISTIMKTMTSVFFEVCLLGFSIPPSCLGLKRKKWHGVSFFFVICEYPWTSTGNATIGAGAGWRGCHQHMLKTMSIGEL